jgi:Transposase and inactivated derivatives, IS30 family
MSKTHNLTLEERIKIKIFISEGYNRSQVATKLERARSTINRELKKWGIIGDLKLNIKDYDPDLAQWLKTDGQGIFKRFEFKLVNNKKLFNKVKCKLKQRWSPQQISAWLKKKYPRVKDMHVSHETIYRFIYNLAKGDLKSFLISCLRRKKRIRKSPQPDKRKIGIIKDRVSIDKRPKSIENRNRVGHWEGDLIIGKNKKTAIGTLVERKTRFTIIVPLKNRKAKTVAKAFARAFNRLPKTFRKSLTYDNGIEMAAHKLFSKLTGMKVYFCNPYSSWERGTNENTNGLIRDFWPKKYDFNSLNYYDIKNVQKLINHRPRRILKWYSPFDLIQKYYL